MRIIKILLLAAIALPLNAQDVNTLSRKIASGSPEVRSAVMSEKARIESDLSEAVLPDPSVEVEHLWGKDENKLTVSASQEFQWPGVYSSRRKAAKADEGVLTSLQQSAFLGKALEAKQMINEIIFNTKSLEILRSLAANMDSLVTLNHTAAKRGEINILDRNKMQIESVMLKERILEAESQLETLGNALNGMADGTDYYEEAKSFTAFPAERILSERQYSDEYATKDPEYACNTLMDMAADQRLKTVKAEQMPSFSLGYVYNLEGGLTYNGFNASMSLPLYSRAHKKAAIKMEKEELAAKKEILDLKNSSNLQADLAAIANLDRRISNLAPLVENEEYMRILNMAYNGGELSTIEYLTEVNYLIENRLGLIKLQYERAQVAARLNRLDLLP